MDQTYELAVLIHPDLESDLDKATTKIEKLIKEVKGSIEATDNWGKKKLAYKINDVDHAIYIFYTVNMPAEAVKKLNDTLNITDEVIRFLITKVDLKAIEKAKEQKSEKAKKAALHEENSAHSRDDESDDVSEKE